MHINHIELTEENKMKIQASKLGYVLAPSLLLLTLLTVSIVVSTIIFLIIYGIREKCCRNLKAALDEKSFFKLCFFIWLILVSLLAICLIISDYIEVFIWKKLLIYTVTLLLLGYGIDSIKNIRYNCVYE